MQEIEVAVMVTRERRFFTKHVPIPQTKQFERIWNIMPSGSRGKRGCNASGVDGQCVTCDGHGEIICPVCGGYGQTDEYEKHDLVKTIEVVDANGNILEDVVSETIDVVISTVCVQCNGEGRVKCDACQGASIDCSDCVEGEHMQIRIATVTENKVLRFPIEKFTSESILLIRLLHTKHMCSMDITTLQKKHPEIPIKHSVYSVLQSAKSALRKRDNRSLIIGTRINLRLRVPAVQPAHYCISFLAPIRTLPFRTLQKLWYSIALCIYPPCTRSRVNTTL